MDRLRRPALEVKQWLPTWGTASWGKPNSKPVPPASFFVSSMPLVTLRALGGVQARTMEARKASSNNVAYQRSHDNDRLTKIARYLEYGYPLSTANGLKAVDHPDLINPGWLPTAILVNVLAKNQSRPRGTKDLVVREDHLVRIEKDREHCFINYPSSTKIDPEKDLAPLEIIDGQHRLLSADFVENLPDDYEVPVVLFDNLDLVWQAYLFWVINVEPKKINTSLAFDLYPELRNQDWLEKGESIKIYQEHRAQELVEVIWRHPASPWHDRIELFGKRIEGHISNAAAIRSLSATFVRAWPRTREDEDEFRRLGGLFGSVDRGGENSYVIGWKRSQQAAFLIECWKAIEGAVAISKAPWISSFRNAPVKGQMDPAFVGGTSLLATDQGFRCVCFSLNALCQVVYQNLGLVDWYTRVDSEPRTETVDACLDELASKSSLLNFLRDASRAMIDGMDWRTSSAPGLDESQKARQGQYRGSSGYTALNKAAIRAVANSSNDLVQEAATKVAQIVGWEDA